MLLLASVISSLLPAAPPPDAPQRLVLRDGREIVGKVALDDRVIAVLTADRSIALASSQVASGGRSDEADIPRVIKLPPPARTKPPAALTTEIAATRLSPPGPDGRRPILVQDPRLGDVKFSAVLTEIGPQSVRWEGVEYQWSRIEPLAAQDTALVNRTIAGSVDLTKAENRLLIAQFLRQARLFGDAEKMLDGLRDAPVALQEKIAAERRRLQSAYAGAVLRNLRIAVHAGNYRAAEDAVAAGKREWLEGAGVAEWDALARRTADAQVQAAALTERLRKLHDAAAGDAGTSGSRTVAKAAELLAAGIHPDQAFALPALPAGPDTDRDRLARLTAALAFGGDVKNAAGFERVERLLTAQERLREYLTAKSPQQRFGVRRSLAAMREVSLSDLWGLLARLPPVEPPEHIDDDRSPAGKTRKGKSAFTAGGFAYLAKLPAHYHPGRDWPVLIALPSSPTKPDEMLAIWSAVADRWGVVLLIADWSNGGPGYRNDPGQHFAALDALRDAGRHYRLDFDRVWLTGLGDGARCCWGTVMSRPDSFAAAAPVCGEPVASLSEYVGHLAAIPTFCLEGERSQSCFHPRGGLDNNKVARDLCERGFDHQLTIFTGRAAEPFAEHADDVMDFLSRRRRDPHPAVIQATSFRRADAVFHWLEIRSVAPTAWRIEIPSPTKPPLPEDSYVHLRAERRGNDVLLRTTRIDGLRINVSPDLFDLDKPVRVLADDRVLFEAVVRPDLQLLLNSAARMGDRRMLHVGGFDLKRLN
mgnify:CR=1 FL=1